MEAPQVYPILGTMTFGSEGQVKPDAAGTIIRSFCGTGSAKTPAGCLIDTARIYQQSTPEGDTEATIGGIFEMFPSLEKKASVATKANAMMAPHFSLSRQSVIDQCNTSLDKLGLDCIDLFYLHSPDIKTDINDTLCGIDWLHKEGKIKEFGLSNYPAWAVVDIWHKCKSRGMVLPSVYQGMYNVITRDMEAEIVPVAREFGLRLYMYNPLAGGLLSGRYRTVDDLANATQGRFSTEFDRAFGDNVKAGSLYRSRYSKEPIFEGLKILQEACAPAASTDDAASAAPVVEESTHVVNGVRVTLQVEETKRAAEGLDMANIALRWLLHHSCLRDGDGVILGVSKNAHLVANLAAWRSGPLPGVLLQACEAAWQAARPACESYFRGYGAKPGGIERFLALKAEQEDEKLAKQQKV